MEDSKGLDVYV